jgi:hypothetical protein
VAATPADRGRNQCYLASVHRLYQCW